MALLSMSGPRKIIDLNPDATELKPGVAYAWQGKVWRPEPVGCVTCIEEHNEEFGDEDVDQPCRTISYEDEDGKEHFTCLKHGECEAIPYSITKHYAIVIAGIKREDEVKLEDVLLFPTAMSLEDREALIMKMIAEQVEIEDKAGPVPGDDE